MKLTQAKAQELADLADRMQECASELNDYLLQVVESFENKDSDARQDAYSNLEGTASEYAYDVATLLKAMRRWAQ